MADLDDFFAKKDRKKAKGKKFTTTEEIAKKLEETGKKVEKPKIKEKPANPEGTYENQPIQEEDEWKNFEEEKKDYTGLKIGNLAVADSELDEGDDDRGNRENRENRENSSDGESGEGGGKHSGPWKKADGPSEPEPQTEVVPEPKPAPATKATYQIPQQRNPQRIERPIGRKAKNVAPDISSEEYFPTLNSKAPAVNDAAGAWGRKKRDEGSFEEVKNQRGGRAYNTPEAQTQAPKLSLGNKYGALEQDQS